MKNTIITYLCTIVIAVSCSRSLDRGLTSLGEGVSIELTSTFTKSIDKEQIVELPNGIKLKKVDSLYYWGDMVFSEDGLDYLCPGITRAAYKNQTNYYWQYGKVYYCYNTNVPDTSAINDAMTELSCSTGVVFLPKRSNTNKYIEFKYSNSNNSKVGMQSGGQVINLYNYNLKNVAEHEIMHSLGFFHEQERLDRDNSISIKWLNINPLEWHNFQKYNYMGLDSGIDFQEFDFDSIMLYNSYTSDTSIAIDTSKPIITKTNGTTYYSGSSALSVKDIAGIKSIYGPPYHRLERHFVSVVEDYISGYYESCVIEMADSLVFYADRNCTIRQALSYPRLLGTISTCEYYDNSGLAEDGTSATITIPAGTTSLCLHHWYDSYKYYCSDPTYGYEVYNHDITNRLVPDVEYHHFH